MEPILAVGEGLCVLPILLVLIIIASHLYEKNKANLESNMWDKAKKDKAWLRGAIKQGGQKCPECGYKTLFWHPRPSFFFSDDDKTFYKERKEYCPKCEIDKRSRYEVKSRKIVEKFGGDDHFECGKCECDRHGKSVPKVCWEEVTTYRTGGTSSMGFKTRGETKKRSSFEDNCMLCEYRLRIK